ncbi:hypothetical protein [Streptomyces sp. NPDC059092]|uniref:hypothetical protein n=1 Tax=Streptomyces sp. NPDC059092 TaxID=3346725 RepID=UPI0036CE4641
MNRDPRRRRFGWSSADGSGNSLSKPVRRRSRPGCTRGRQTTTVPRTERAEVTLKHGTVAAMPDLYQVTEPEKPNFLDLSEKANLPGWWQRYRDVLPEAFGLYVSLDASAARIPARRTRRVAPAHRP